MFLNTWCIFEQLFFVAYFKEAKKRKETIFFVNKLFKSFHENKFC